MRRGLFPILFPTRWTPLNLGASLLGWWDAQRTDLITSSGGAVSSWKDIVAAYDASQSTGSLKPVYSPVSFGGLAGVKFDGVDDFLNYEAQPFPSGASPCEIWELFQNTAPNDASQRVNFAYGGSSSVTGRHAERLGPSSISRADTEVGTGGATGDATNLNLAMFLQGRYVVRHIIGATTTTTEINGITMTPVSMVAATGTTRTRFGATLDASPALNGSLIYNTLMVTAPLSAADAALNLKYLSARGGI